MKFKKFGIALFAGTILGGLSAPTIQAATSATSQQATVNNDSQTDESSSEQNTGSDQNVVYTTEGQDGPTTQSSTDTDNSLASTLSSNDESFNSTTTYASPNENYSGEQLNSMLKSGSEIVGKHTYTISKGTINTVKDLTAIAAGGIIAAKVPPLAPVVIPVAEYIIQRYKIGYKLRVHILDVKNTSGGVTTVVKKYTWIKA
ncbi:hypothetical protein ACFQ22_02635 [Lentilactobacillus raoultii]|uniref:Uncharacterized protein n=1 Tax=Lentilactobacillus raoultii TaxID=1987503 RepID=A0ABW3PM62_9LACO|nr:hypothetical protein [Lentilactobacillus raoultii]